MQVLSHWTYISTGRQLTRLDLQGGVSMRGAVFADPAVLARTAEAQGLTDRGPHGIATVLVRHTCGHCSREEWTRPRGVPMGRALLPLTQGTTMRRDGCKEIKTSCH